MEIQTSSKTLPAMHFNGDGVPSTGRFEAKHGVQYTVTKDLNLDNKNTLHPGQILKLSFKNKRSIHYNVI